MPRRRKIQPEPDPEASRPEQPVEQHPEPAPTQDVVTGPVNLGETTDTTRWRSRYAFRYEVIESIRDAAGEKAVPIEGGPLDGVAVVSFGTLAEILDALVDEPLPPPSDRSAEVATPATILVSAICPRCGLGGEIAMSVGAQLVVQTGKSELGLKAKASTRAHSCGQLLLPRDVVEGQVAVDEAIAEAEAILTDAATDTAAADEPQGEDAEGCPVPGCSLAAEHEGDHDVQPPEDILG